MKVHAPEGYDCPFCRLVDAAESGCSGCADVVWVEAETTAFVSPKWWRDDPGERDRDPEPARREPLRDRR